MKRNDMIQHIGSFENRTGKMIVSDSTHPNGWIGKVAKGTWFVEVGYNNTEISFIEAAMSNPIGDYHKLATVEVKSGKVCITDYTEEFGSKEMISRINKSVNKQYAGVGLFKHIEEGLQIRGMVGMGRNGRYPLYGVKNQLGDIGVLLVVFNRVKVTKIE